MKKAIVTLLTAALVSSLLTGCQKKEPANTDKVQEKQTVTPTKADGKKSNADSTPTPEEYSGPKGRYVDEAFKLPEEVAKNNIEYLTPNDYPTGCLAEAYGCSNDFSHFYRFRLKEDLTWDSEELKWAEDAMPKDNGHSWAEGFTYGKDGKGYFIYYSNDGKDGHVIRQVSDTKWEDLNIAYLKGTDANGRKPHPQAIEVDTNGDIYLGDSQSYTVISGDTLKEVASYSPANELNGLYLTDDSVYMISTKDSTIYQYSKSDHSKQNTYQYESSKPYSARICVDEKGSLYLIAKEGLFSLQKDNSTWEMIWDGSLGILCDPSIDPGSVCLGKDSDYYFWANSVPYHVYYNKDVPTQPAKTLSVYALFDSDEIHKVAALYQMNHPEYKVDLKIATDAIFEQARDEINASDYITALNTELLSGKGADVLILDGLPYESYIEKNILVDLYDYVPSLKDISPFHSNLIKGSEIDGKLYYLPTYYRYYAIQGSDELLNAATSIHSIMEYMKSSGNTQYFSNWSQSDFCEFVLNLEADRLFSKSKFLNEADMKELFQDIRSIQDMTDDGLNFETMRDETQDRSSAKMDRLLKDANTLSASYIAGPSSNMDFAYVDANRDGEIRSLTNEFVPRTMAGINQASGQKEAAGSFIDYLLAPENQKCELFTRCIPLRLTALDELRTSHADTLCTGFGNYTIGLAENEQNNKFADIALGLTNMRPFNNTLYHIYKDTLMDFLGGSADAESVASELYNRVQISFKE